ncbi:hypothetical protein ACNKHK_08750 [Shigella flexneri]
MPGLCALPDSKRTRRQTGYFPLISPIYQHLSYTDSYGFTI